ncbi:MAG: hypothetical protein WBB96_10590 [Candidatus Dechloromonas phosphoritropha]
MSDKELEQTTFHLPAMRTTVSDNCSNANVSYLQNIKPALRCESFSTKGMTMRSLVFNVSIAGTLLWCLLVAVAR